MKAQVYWDEDMVLQVYAHIGDEDEIGYLHPLPIDVPDELFRQYQAARAALREVTRLIADTCGESPPNKSEAAKARDEAERAAIMAEIEREDALSREEWLAEHPENRALYDLLNSPTVFDND